MIGLDCQGVIVNISSLFRAAKMAQTNSSAAKAAVAAITVTCAKQLGRHNIRCAVIAPGFTATELLSRMNQAVLDVISAKIAIGRLAEPDEIAQAMLQIFDNDYMSGNILEVDAGLRLQTGNYSIAVELFRGGAMAQGLSKAAGWSWRCLR